jgi:serine/threonine protein kinase
MLPCGKALDLWDLGVLAYELSNYIPPFSNSQITNKATFSKVVKAAERKMKWHNTLSPELKDLIMKLLRLNPE